MRMNTLVLYHQILRNAQGVGVIDDSSGHRLDLTGDSSKHAVGIHSNLAQAGPVYYMIHKVANVCIHAYAYICMYVRTYV